MKTEPLQIEVRTDKALAEPILAGGRVLITPPVGDDWWLFRVAVSDKQAVIGFPKFGIVGVGFQVEKDDWNTNLPSSCDANRIYEHIKANKGDDAIPKARCVKAIEMIQAAVKQYTP